MTKEVDRSTPDLNLLTNLLSSYGIPVDEWGKGDAKTVAHLLKEIEEGSAQIITSEKTIQRVVRCAAIRIFYRRDGKTLYLKEDRQVFKDGRTRRRDWFTWSVSEKIEPGETPDQAALRGIQEELGITVSENQHLQITGVYHKNINSPSYPGLSSSYESNFFDLYLTSQQFNPEGYRENQPDKATYWIWTKSSPTLTDQGQP